MIEEIWKAYPLCISYEVSNLGGLRSVDRYLTLGGNLKKRHARFIKGKVLRPDKVYTGHLCFHVPGQGKTGVHRMVMNTFMPNTDPTKKHVNHINGIKTDNRLENLEWCTPSENTLHSFRVLGRVSHMKGVFGGDCVLSKAVTGICLQTGFVREYRSAVDARADGFDKSSIGLCCRGKAKTHKNHYWFFTNSNN